MPELKLSETLYHNADKTRVVKEGSPQAAFLIGREGKVLTEARARELGLGKGALEEVKPTDRLEAEQDAIEAAKERGATEEAAIRLHNLDRVKLEIEHADKQAEPLPMGDADADDSGSARKSAAKSAAKSSR